MVKLHCESKKTASFLFLENFVKRRSIKSILMILSLLLLPSPCTQMELNFPLHINYVAALPCKMRSQDTIFQRNCWINVRGSNFVVVTKPQMMHAVNFDDFSCNVVLYPYILWMNWNAGLLTSGVALTSRLTTGALKMQDMKMTKSQGMILQDTKKTKDCSSIIIIIIFRRRLTW